jgi:hypothetical protein
MIKQEEKSNDMLWNECVDATGDITPCLKKYTELIEIREREKITYLNPINNKASMTSIKEKEIKAKYTGAFSILIIITALSVLSPITWVKGLIIGIFTFVAMFIELFWTMTLHPEQIDTRDVQAKAEAIAKKIKKDRQQVPEDKVIDVTNNH